MNLDRSLHASALALALAFAGVLSGCASSLAEESDQDEGAATVGGAAAGALGTEYRGTLGTSKIVVRLAAQGTGITGSYFYEGTVTNGAPITLRGTLAGSKVTLDESVAGKKTGAFSITLEGKNLEGSWTKPDGSASKAIALSPIPTGTPVVIARTISASEKQCKAKIEYADVYGLADANAEAAINKTLGESVKDALAKVTSCQGPSQDEITQTVNLSGNGLLTIAEERLVGSGKVFDVSRWMNFRLATGKDLSLIELLAPDTNQGGCDGEPCTTAGKLFAVSRDFLEAHRNADTDAAITELGAKLQTPADMKFQVTGDGLTLMVILPNAGFPLPMPVALPWADVKALVAPGSEVAALAKR